MNVPTDPESQPTWPDLMATLAGLLIFGSCGWVAASSVAAAVGVWSGDPTVATSVATVATVR